MRKGTGMKRTAREEVGRLSIGFLAAGILVGCVGCAAASGKRAGVLMAEQPATPAASVAEPSEKAEEPPPIQIREFILSPGDELKISVLQHDELTRTVQIPPDGVIFYPIAGEIDTRGMGLRDIRARITRDLSRYRGQELAPGDEISFGVFLHDEFSRRFIIPSDGNIFVPYAGTINVEGKSIAELTQIISVRLVKYVTDPQVVIDIVRLNNPARIVDPQVDIELTTIGGRKVFVLGEVNRPGVFVADGELDVVGAIASAGGATLDAKTENVVLMRGGVAQKGSEVTVFDLKKMLRDGDRSGNLTLQKGDVIYVPRTFIAKVDRFFEHLAKIIKPIVDAEIGYWVGQNISVGPRDAGPAHVTP